MPPGGLELTLAQPTPRDPIGMMAPPERSGMFPLVGALRRLKQKEGEASTISPATMQELAQRASVRRGA